MKESADRLTIRVMENMRTTAVVGAGLGLAICRTIVRAHGGEIEAGDRPSGGASFQFTLPTEEPAP